MRHVYGWLLLTPAAILLIAFTHYPTIATVIDSLFSKGTAIQPSHFVALANYEMMRTLFFGRFSPTTPGLP